MANDELDADALQAKATLIGGYSAGALIAAMCSLGVRLGLYQAMRDAASLTSDELAASTGYHERWLREWLRAQAAANVIDYEGNDRFSLSPEAAALLADPTSLRSMEANLSSIPDRLALVPRVEESFRTGLGFSVDDRGESAASGIDGIFANWHQQRLVSDALPLLDGIVAKLEAGARVADVGSGSGLAAIAIAEAFPKAEVHGFDISSKLLAIAARRSAEAEIANVHFHDLAEESLPQEASFDLLMTFDCLHDMHNTHDVARQIRAAVKPNGTWFIADIDSRASFEENLVDNPGAAGGYSISILACLASGLSVEGGAGYGTLGLPEPAMRELVAGAGFRRFRRLELSGVGSAFYETRP